ncbi:MAG: hypothetical protein COZ23_00335 [Hydrogenophilales bacterium CG_4_10_14_3_um_filter_58_23]|nr:MAG: hypothetical protein COW70_01675 [Hydrogenophilales bacterium CG18_big_fil_WC_8_21_14_2_50_58_12]PIY01967.1 MAG: hypothetical protein COZ23_00335 [Hydrogenophilales bacterium CG_4_10_14_3_um_filter_58_23]
MRYVPSLPPLPSVKEEDEPHPLRAVQPVRPTEHRTRVPRVIQRFGPKAGAEEVAGGPVAVRLEKRATSDRRDWCRRLKRGQPFLDTRSAVERRKKKRRDSDIVTTLDEEG